MKGTLLGILLLLVPIFLQAQATLVLKDGNSNVLGISTSLGLNGDIEFMTLNDMATKIDNDGWLRYSTSYARFSEPDCTGLEYSDYHYAGVSPRFIRLESTNTPYPIALLPAVPIQREAAVRSYRAFNCYNYESPITMLVTPLADCIVSDPGEYGMEILPETGTWGFKPPYSIEVVAPKIIFCNGFDTCPTQQ